jgi:hypothetical protein
VLVHNCNNDYSDVALGLRKEGDLRNVADSRGYTHFLDSDDYESEVRDVAHEHPDATLHVVLDGFTPGPLTDGSAGSSGPADLFEAAYAAGKGDNWFATEREMYHVGKSVMWGDRDWSSIKFYQGGSEVKVPLPGFLGGG